MINHAYALLRNAPGTTGPSPTGEYVPPDYRPAVLPNELLAVRGVLFGAAPDRTALDYRLRQYLTVLHAGPYANYVTSFDPRVTYWPFTAAPPFAFGVTVTQVGNNTAPLYLGGAPAGEAGSGLTQYQFQVKYAAGVTGTGAGRRLIHLPFLPPRRTAGSGIFIPASLTVTQSVPSFLLAITNLSFTSGLSQPVPLAGSGLNARVGVTAADGSTWMVAVSVPPDGDPAAVLGRLAGLGGPVFDALFGVSPAEPFLSFRNLWQSGGTLPDRLAGVLLALAYQTDLLRLAGRLQPN